MDSSDSSFAFRVELLIERRRGVGFTLAIGVGDSDLFIDGGIDLLRALLIETLIILVSLTGSGDTWAGEGLDTGIFGLISLLDLLIRPLACISCRVFIITSLSRLFGPLLSRKVEMLSTVTFCLLMLLT